MRDAFGARAVRAGALLLAAAALAGCKPGKKGGYEAVSHRTSDGAPMASHPSPPPVVAGLIATNVQRIQATNLPQGVTQAMVDQGQDQFGSVCAACHGQNGTGTTQAPPLNDAAWLNISGSYDEILGVVNAGVPAPKQYPAPMPAKGGAPWDDAQVRAVSAYVFALSHQGGA
jgi:mono/diheme cytochrome c family protein